MDFRYPYNAIFPLIYCDAPKISKFSLLLDMSSLNDLAITSTNAAMTSIIGGAWSYLQSRLANGGRDNNCRFYYNNGAGGSVLQVVARSVTGGFVSGIKDMAENAFNSLLDGKKSDDNTQGSAWLESENKKQKLERDNYGKMRVTDEKGQERIVYALDDWGGIATEALMLGVQVDNPVTITQSFPQPNVQQVTPKNNFWNTDLVFHKSNNPVYKNLGEYTTINGPFKSNTLVWYDTTALITVNSDKNLISTKVQGRDYSRKELVSNGDIRFSVSGQITSGLPDIYPSEEMAKFLKVMQYKGIVKVNSQVLDQFGITHIVITDFSITPKEGYKALQQYSFNAIGLQPEKETEITEDTITILARPAADTVSDDGNAWVNMLKNQLDGLKSMAEDAFSQGLAISTGLLDKVL